MIRHSVIPALAAVVVVIVCVGPATEARSKRIDDAADLSPTTTSLSLKPSDLLALDEDDARVVATVDPIPDHGQVLFRTYSDAGLQHLVSSDEGPVDTATGRAEVIPYLDPGTYWWQATFAGSSYFERSTSDSKRQVIHAKESTLTISVDHQHIQPGETAIFTVASDASARGRLTLIDGVGSLVAYAHFDPLHPGGFDPVLTPGVHHVRAHFEPAQQFTAWADEWSDAVTVVVGDATPPSAGIRLDYGRPTTGDSEILVGVEPGAASVVAVRLSDAADTDADGVLVSGQDVPFVTTIDHTIDTSGPDGWRTVYAQFQFGDLTWSDVMHDRIYLDRTAPTGSFVINDDDATLGDPWPSNGLLEQTLKLHADDDAMTVGGRIDLVAISNDGHTWAYRTQPMVGDASNFQEGWQVVDDAFGAAELVDGITPVYVKFRDSAGNWSDIVTDAIDVMQYRQVAHVLVDGQPGYLGGGPGYTTETHVTLTVPIAVMPPEGLDTLRIGSQFGGGPGRTLDWHPGISVEWSLIDPALGYDNNDGYRDIYVALTSTTGRKRVLHEQMVLDRTVPTGDAPAAAFAPDSTVDLVRTPASAPGSASMVTSVLATIGWNGRDNTKVAANHLQRSVDGGTWSSIPLPKAAASSVSQQLSEGPSYRFRVRSTDAAGNAGAWKTGGAFHVDVVQDGSSAISYHGTWATTSRSDALGGALRTTHQVGASATLTFTGRGVAWIAPRSFLGDYVPVWIDGKLVKKVHLTVSAGYHPRRVVFSTSWTKAGTHTIKLGKQERTAALPLDAFLVLR